jgi:hypothetical protein
MPSVRQVGGGGRDRKGGHAHSAHRITVSKRAQKARRPCECVTKQPQGVGECSESVNDECSGGTANRTDTERRHCFSRGCAALAFSSATHPIGHLGGGGVTGRANIPHQRWVL